MAQSAKQKGQEFISNKISGDKGQQGQSEGQSQGQGDQKSNPLKRYVLCVRGVNVSVANLIPVSWTRPRRSSLAVPASKIFAVQLVIRGRTT